MAVRPFKKIRLVYVSADITLTFIMKKTIGDAKNEDLYA